MVHLYLSWNFCAVAAVAVIFCVVHRNYCLSFFPYFLLLLLLLPVLGGALIIGSVLLCNSFSLWDEIQFNPGCLPGNETTWELDNSLLSNSWVLPWLVATYCKWVILTHLHRGSILGQLVLEALFSSSNCWSVRDLERNLLKYCHSNGQWVRICNCSLHRNLEPFREDLQWTVRNRYATANSNIPYSPHCGL